MYSPKIDEKIVPMLYRISKEIGKPMTALVNDIITDWIERRKIVLDLLNNKEA